MTARRKLVLVTDPMCSWCWGMTGEFERARKSLGHSVEFELMLGGINTHGTQPIGDYGRRFLMRLWREVEATTGQQFGYTLPETYVHNSVRSCLAVEVVREVTAMPPFEYLAELQRQFFLLGQDITSEPLLKGIAAAYGVSAEEFDATMGDPKLLEKVRFQFTHAQSFGTQALPSLLEEDEAGVLRLFAGGYVDEEMLATLLSA